MARILLVEDEPSIRNMCERVLVKAGLEVEACAHGVCALSTNVMPDILLVDYELPDMPGIEIIKALRCRDATVSVIVMSGHSREYLAELVPAADAILEKPFTPAELRYVIDAMLVVRRSKGSES